MPDEVAVASEPRLEVVEGREQRVVGRLVRRLRAREAAAVDAVVHLGIDDLVDAVDLRAQGRRIEVGVIARDAGELGVEHSDDFRGFVVDDAAGLAVPQGRHRDLAGVARVGGRVGLVQIIKSVDAVRRAVGEMRVVGEGPALIPKPGDRVGDGDRAFQFLERAVDQGAVRPRAAVRHIEVIAAGLRLESRRTVGADAVAEPALGSAERAVLADLLRQFLVAPRAVDQHAHEFSPGRTLAARVAAVSVAARALRLPSG